MNKNSASQKTYRELLKHPNWQKKRLEILQTNEFQCQECGEDDLTLHIHHTYYEKGFKPWEYPNDSLWCLCERCHSYFETLKTILSRSIGKLSSLYLEKLIGFAMGLESLEHPLTNITITTYEMAEGLGRVHTLSADTVIKLLDDNKTSGNKLINFSIEKRERLQPL